MMNLLKKYREIIMYIIFGLLTTFVGWGSYVVFVNSFPIDNKDILVFVSNLLRWICGVVFAFVTNKLWVFNSKSWKKKLVIKEAVTFVSSRAITGVLEIFGVPLLASTGYDGIFFNIVKAMGISMKLFYTEGIYSKMSVAVIVIILNYVFSKLFVFKDKKD